MSDADKLKKTVKKHYGDVATGKSGCCCGTAQNFNDLSHGYDATQLAQLPEGAALGLGCGNPLLLVEIRPGWRVLDLGSGGGIDVFLAAAKVGASGSVVGLDMTDEMLNKARENAVKGGFTNVTFQKGEIEAMPFSAGEFDLVISNCVINLVPDKSQAYREIYRVLKPGGRFAIADMATRGEMPAEVRKSAEAWAGCVAGALDLDAYLALVKAVGFRKVETKFVKEYDYERSEAFALLSVGLVGYK